MLGAVYQKMAWFWLCGFLKLPFSFLDICDRVKPEAQSLKMLPVYPIKGSTELHARKHLLFWVEEMGIANMEFTGFLEWQRDSYCSPHFFINKDLPSSKWGINVASCPWRLVLAILYWAPTTCQALYWILQRTYRWMRHGPNSTRTCHLLRELIWMNRNKCWIDHQCHNGRYKKDSEVKRGEITFYRIDQGQHHGGGQN